MYKKQRLLGIDLVRGIAAYAVVVIHAVHPASTPALWAAKMSDFCQFAVPFFLATSFYLVMDSLYVRGTTYSLKSKLPRLLIPYAIWSGIYIFQRCCEYLALKTGDINTIFQDPLALLFFGGAAYHIYFLPLLFSGTIFVKAIEYLVNRRAGITQLILLLISSLIIYNLLLTSGNSYQLDTATAFSELLNAVLPDGNKNLLLRLILVEFSWIIRCLPYILVAMVLNHPLTRKQLPSFNTISTVVIFSVFLVLNVFGSYFLPGAVHEVGRGYFALFFALSLSSTLKENLVIKNLGMCSFGIYLIHLLILHVFEGVAKKVYPGFATLPISFIYISTLSTIIFILSWIATSFLLRRKTIARLIFGI